MAHIYSINGQSAPASPVIATIPSHLNFPTTLTRPFELPNLNTAQPAYTEGLISAIPDHDDAHELPTLRNPNHIVFPMYRGNASADSEPSNSARRTMKPLLSTQAPTSHQSSYRPHQLSKLMLKSENSSDHLRRIHVTESQYCRERSSGQEFILFSVLDRALPRISNWLTLDRNQRRAMKNNGSAKSQSIAQCRALCPPGQNASKNTIDPGVYKIPRNHDIFPTGLGCYVNGQESLEQPLPYTLIQLKSLLQRSNREYDHTERIYVASAEYCKRLGHVKHEFILLEVKDNRIPQISNFVVLDRTVELSSGTITAASTSISSNSPAQDRLRVSYYGEKKLLIKQCNLGRYEVLEQLKLPSPAASTPLLLCELVIFAHETSKRRSTYNLMKSQCFWFASCVWECMLKLRPEACRTTLAASNNRGKLGTFRLVVDSREIGEVFHKAEDEIEQFLKQLAPERKEDDGQESKI